MEFYNTVIAVIILFFVGIIALFIWSWRKSGKDWEKNKLTLAKEEELQNSFLATIPNLHKDVEMVVPDHALLTHKKNFIIADDTNKVLYINQNAYPFSIVRGGELITSTTATTTEHTNGGVGRAVVGGLVGGAAGAVVGASTASKTSQTQLNTTIEGVRVLFANIANPSVTIKSVDKNSCERFLELIRYIVDDNARYQNSTLY